MTFQTIEEYLARIQTCPDAFSKLELDLKSDKIDELGVYSPLELRFGVRDNYSMFFGDHQLIQDFCDQEYTEQTASADTRTYLSENKVQIVLKESTRATIGFGLNLRNFAYGARKDAAESARLERHIRQTKISFPSSIMLHPMGTGSEEAHARNLATTIGQICNYALDQQIGICLPNARNLEIARDFYEQLSYNP